MVTSRTRLIVPVAVAMFLGVVLGAACAHATCDPTNDPDKTDIANARAAVGSNCDCAGASTHGAYVSCAAQQANLTLTNKSCAGAVRRCAAHSTCGKPTGAVTCCVTKPTGTKCKIKRDAAHCKAPTGGTACVGSYPSCCDACGSAGCAPPTTVPTTTTTSSTLCPPGNCGNGVYQPECGEQCDGTVGSPNCPLPSTDLGCFPPGTLDECTCCTNTVGCLTYGTELQCCDPTATCIFISSLGYGGSCYHRDCSPDHDCSYGRCVGGTCCTDVGAPCSEPGGGGGYVPCCPPAVCPGIFGVFFCCLPGGETCSRNAECCSGACNPQTSTCS